MLLSVITLLPIAIGFALSPVPLVELILVLFSRRRAINSITFVIALMLATCIAVFLGAAGGQASGDTQTAMSTPAIVIMMLLGLLLLVLGWQNWSKRADTSEPKMLSMIYEMGPAPVALLALGTALFNPKNLPLLLAAGATIGAATAPFLTGVIFVLLATLPFLVSALYSLLGGAKAAQRLDALRSWLIAKNRVIMGIICLALGLVILARALAGLVA